MLWLPQRRLQSRAALDTTVQIEPVIVAPQSHRYWRIYFTAASFQNWGTFGLYEVAFAKLGQAMAGGGTATALNEWSGGIFPPSQAIDGNEGTGWFGLSGAGAPNWLKVDFGSAVEVNTVRIKPIDFNTGSAANTYSFSIDYSDDNSNWTTDWSVANAPIFRHSGSGFDGGGLQSFPKPNITSGGRVLWKLDISDIYTTPRIREMQFRGSVGGPDMVPVGSPSWDWAQNGASVNMYDNNTSTFWASGQQGATGWTAVEFPGSFAVRQLGIQVVNSEAPKTFNLNYSGDGLNWTTALSVVNTAAWSTDEERFFTVLT